MSSHAFRQSLDDSIVKIDPSKALTSTHSLIERTIYPNWPMYAHVLSQCKSVCGKSWGSNAMAYKCKTCEKDPTCIICVDCFKKSNHEGHDYKLIRTGGGMCDCGDTDAWDPKGFCTDHQGIAEDSDCVSQLPEAPRRMLQELVGFSIKTVVRCLRIVASQAAASPLMDSIGFLLEGLIRVSQTGDAGRRLVAEVVCEGKDASLQDIFDLESGDHPMPPWNGALAPLHQLIYALIPDPWFKYRFARLLILQYVPLHLKQEANAVGRKHSQEKFLVSTAVQVLSVPSIIDRLLNADILGFRKGAHIFHLMSTGLLSALIAYLMLQQTKPNLIHVQEFDIYRDPAKAGVSFSLPLHRYLARILTNQARANATLSDVALLLPYSDLAPTRLSHILEFPLNLQVIRAQVHERMWQRDHMSVHAQVHFYETAVSHIMLIPDVNLLQIGACVLGPHAMVSQMCARYLNWNPHEGVGLKHMLNMIIVIATNKWSKDASIRQHVVNVLAQGPHTHSEIQNRVQSVQEDDDSDDEIDITELLESVAIKRTSTKPVSYILKDEVFSEVSFYDSEIHLRNVEAIIKHFEDRYQHKKPLPHFLPRVVDTGPYVSSVLMLHCPYSHHAAIAAIAASYASTASHDPALRCAIDLIVLALSTIHIRDKVMSGDYVATKNDAKYALLLSRTPASVINLVPSASIFTTDILFNLKQVIATTPKYIAPNVAINKTSLEMLQDLKGREGYKDFHAPIDTILGYVDSLCPELGVREVSTITLDSPQTEDSTAATSQQQRKQAMQEKQAKALERMRKKQAAFEGTSAEGVTPTATDKDSKETPKCTLLDAMNDFVKEQQCVFCHDAAKNESLGLIVSTSRGGVLHTVHSQLLPEKHAHWHEAFPFEFSSVVCPQRSSLHLHACGHSMHTTCLTKHLDYLREARKREEHFRGANFLKEDEFLCPLCGRIGASAIPLHTGAPSDGKPLIQNTPGVEGHNNAFTLDTFQRTPREWTTDKDAYERNNTSLMWLHTALLTEGDDDGADDDLSGNIFESAIKIWATQVALLELQIRTMNGLLNVKTLQLLRTTLEAMVSYALVVPTQEVKTEIAEVGSRLLHIMNHKPLVVEEETDPTLDICNAFTLYVLNLFHSVLPNGSNDGTLYKQNMSFFLDLERRQHGDVGVDVLLRQMGIIHFILFPHEVVFPSNKVKISEELIPYLSSRETMVTLLGLSESIHSAPPLLNISTMKIPFHGPQTLSNSTVLPYLTSLQNNYLDLMNSRGEEVCSVCNNIPREPLLCLKCGRLCCFKNLCCPQECSQHADECGGGSMLFLMLKKTAVLLLCPDSFRIAMLPSPYLDDHGEEDIGLRRGKPIFKNDEAITALNQLWLTGAYYQDTGTVLERLILLRDWDVV